MISLSKIRQIIEKEDEGPTLDYKEDLTLGTEGDKAQFVKDVLSLANSGETAHIITGVEDGTRKLVGIKASNKAEQLNDILKGKCDPPLSVEYAERNILGHKVGVVEIVGENPPYIVAVPDRFGGPLSSASQKKFYIERGTVFVRKFNKNEGACRTDLDKMYKLPYITLQADLQLSHEMSIKQLDELQEVDITFFLTNQGEVIATNTYIWLQFKDIKEIVRCKGSWSDQSKRNDNIPTVQLIYTAPIISPVRMDCNGVVVKVDNDVQQIETYVHIGATNMRTKHGPYSIPLKGKEQN